MRTAWMAGVAGLLIAGIALAQEHPEHPKKGPAQPPPAASAKVVEATVTGENICLGCTLKKEEGAAAQCAKYGHRHALRVTGATAAGKDLPEMKGWILHYLETDKAQPFVKEHHAETLALKGKVYPAARVLEVDRRETAKKPEGSGPEHPEHPKKPEGSGPEHPEHPK